MTLTIELTKEQEETLAGQANGKPLDEFARDVLLKAVGAPISGKDVLQYWKQEGIVGIWADRDDIGDSVEFARKLRSEAERRLE